MFQKPCTYVSCGVHKVLDTKAEGLVSFCQRSVFIGKREWMLVGRYLYTVSTIFIFSEVYPWRLAP